MSEQTKYCFVEECIHFKDGGICSLKNPKTNPIYYEYNDEIDEDELDFDNYKDICADFHSYKDTPEYQSEYWKCVHIGKSNKLFGRAVSKGKHIQINGYDFFTESDDRVPETEIYVTEAKTGYLAGTIQYIKTHWDMIVKLIGIMQNVKNYPVVVFNTSTRTFHKENNI